MNDSSNSAQVTMYSEEEIMRKYNLLKMLSQFLLVLSFFFCIGKTYGFSNIFQSAVLHDTISLFVESSLKLLLSSENIRDPG